ncbi:MAG: ABC-2 family transporter protein [Candidatus Wallbacteria bacterium]|nr:ABC-2 family transporter protein [Candidatus Wallbacteria bacterium]
MRGAVLRTLTSFTAYLQVGLRASRAYLFDCVIGLATYPIEVAITYLMWRLFLTEGAGAMTHREALAYYALALLVARVGPSRFVSFRLESEIASGGLALYLVRPAVPWAAIAGRELAPAVVNLVVLTPVAFLVTTVALGRLPGVGGFAFLMVLAVGVQTLLRLIVGTAAFWMLQIMGLVHAVDLVVRLASGGVLPLTVFSAGVADALAWTPFPLLVWVPIQAMMGRLEPPGVAWHGAIGLFWLVALLAVFLALWRKGVRGYVGYGT